ncbi:hypothetical protein CHARACLAT_004777 [Characodon lateralis]|uniref:Uncharacterized protein n=1 Tax=Characodon lateralis TaxID=208331 RepID=A0ABU7CPH2_9TELE|nr:hypothetical protein [Characodon lateralis]
MTYLFEFPTLGPAQDWYSSGGGVLLRPRSPWIHTPKRFLALPHSHTRAAGGRWRADRAGSLLHRCDQMFRADIQPQTCIKMSLVAG